MNTTIKTILIAILLPLSIFSQSRFKVTKCSSDLYMGGSWVTFQTNYPKTMLLDVDGNVFRINNADHSVYTLTGDSTVNNYPEYITYTWNAYDKDHKDCHAMITQLLNDDCTFYFSIFYEAKCYNWMLKEVN